MSFGTPFIISGIGMLAALFWSFYRGNFPRDPDVAISTLLTVTVIILALILIALGNILEMDEIKPRPTKVLRKKIKVPIK